MKRASSKLSSSRLSAAFGRTQQQSTSTSTPITTPRNHGSHGPTTTSMNNNHYRNTISIGAELSTSRLYLTSNRRSARLSIDENSRSPFSSLDMQLATIDETISAKNNKKKPYIEWGSNHASRHPLLELDSNALDVGHRIFIDEPFEIPTVAQTDLLLIIITRQTTFPNISTTRSMIMYIVKMLMEPLLSIPHLH